MKAVAGSHELNVILKTAPTQPCLDHTFFWGRFVTALCGCLEWQWVEPEVVTLSYYLNQIVNAWVLLFLITPLLSFGFGLLFLRPVKTWMVTWQNANSLNVSKYVLHSSFTLTYLVTSPLHEFLSDVPRVGGKLSKWICYMKVAQDRLNEAESYESHMLCSRLTYFSGPCGWLHDISSGRAFLRWFWVLQSSASISCRNIFQTVRMPLVAQLQAGELTFLQFAFSVSLTFLCSEGRDMVNGSICLSLAAPWLQSKQPLNLRLCAWETQAVTLLVILSSRRSIVGSFFYLEASGECLTDSVVMMLQPIFECFKKAVFSLMVEHHTKTLLSC